AFSGILSQEKFSERPDATTPSVPSTATAPEPANSSPTQTTAPSAASSTTPADAPTMADSSAIDDVTDPAMRKLIQHLVGQGFFEPVTDGRFYPNDPISRAELVTLLYRAYQLNNPFVSEFPYYRDVETDHWAYQPIEAFRVKRWVSGMNDDGYFMPDKPVSLLETALVIHRSLPKQHIRTPLTEAATVLAALQDELDDKPAEAVWALTRNIKGHLIPYNPAQPYNQFQRPITRLEAVAMLGLLEQITRQYEVNTDDAMPLPENLVLTVSPAESLTFSQIQAGQTVAVTVQDPVTLPNTAMGIIERGSKGTGVITAVNQANRQASVVIDEIILPSGKVFTTRAELSLAFKDVRKLLLSEDIKHPGDTPENELFMVVPGQVYTMTTLPLPASKPPAPTTPTTP
ncbi:MAG: S-layer homology domain-containing protein, partial [Cyanobacteria bacterium HKST-UBA04]|nr:S-layer homology domain-containing protein [Cyanobacteria bacterium HKST-UBA04]